MLGHLDVLETMGPEGFLEFRDPLDARLGLPVAPVPPDRVDLGLRDTFPRSRAAAGADLYEAFCACAGCRRTTRRASRRSPTSTAITRRPAAGRAATRSAELLVDHDEGDRSWRLHHSLMAAREIGSRQGTGGSRGVEYLRGTVDKRFYPELWEVRVAL